MRQRQRRAKFRRRQWHSVATRNMSAAAVATSAALAMAGLEAGAGAARPLADATTSGMATQVASVTPVSGVTPTISAPITFHGKLFYGTAAAGGGKLWETTGTTAKLLKQIRGKANAPTELTNVSGHLYFTADGELWKSSGTPASTEVVDSHVDPVAMANAGGTLFFETTGGLWKSKGTPATTREVKAIKLTGTPELIGVSGRVYFTDPKSGHAYDSPDLWTSNGTTAGTTTVLQPKNSYGFDRVYDPAQLTNVGGHLYFSGVENLAEAQYSDLFEASDAKAKPLEPYGDDLINDAGSLYFFDFATPKNCNTQEAAEEGCGDDVSRGYALWKGTKPLFDFSPTTYADTGNDQQYAPYAEQLTPVGSTLFFAAKLGGPTPQLWRSQGGVETGLADVGPVAPHDLVNGDGTLFFTGNSGDGTQVWESNGSAPAQNGTDAGTFAVTDFPTTANAPRDLTDLGGTLYFTANDGAAGGYGLWSLPTTATAAPVSAPATTSSTVTPAATATAARTSTTISSP